jgi:catechol 2,3-dioxygenase-like lactoylglutathione lyase family enzyme
MSVTDLPRIHAWYQEAFGYQVAAGTNMFKGYLAEKVQGVKGAASSCWWLMDGQDFFQLELFQFYRPEVRPLPADWRPSDIGYSTIGLWVADFDAVLARLDNLGTTPLTSPVGGAGHRRVCVRDPEGVLLELMESDPLGDERQLARPNAPVVTVSVTLSVADIEKSLAFFRDVLELEDAGDLRLHEPAHEVLWGLAGADCQRHVLRAGQSLVELVQYRDPSPRPQAQDYRISDQGLLNIALGFRSRNEFNRIYRRCLDAGIQGNWRPLDLAAWKVVYVNDSQGFSVELLHVQPWWDRRMGFKPGIHPPAPAGAIRKQ